MHTDTRTLFVSLSGHSSYSRTLRLVSHAVQILLFIPYAKTVREPLDKLDPNHSDFDAWEIIMYVLALSFSFEGS